MKVVSTKICPFVQRVTALLEAKGLEYEIEYISLKDKPDWFLDASPHGQVPLLITDESDVLFESDAICEYIEEKFGPLQELSAEERAGQRAWAYLASKNYLVQCGAQRSKDKETLDERSEKLNKAFDRIENKLSDTKYFNGDDLGIVDVAWFPLLHRAAIVERKTNYDFIGNRAMLKAWQKHLLETDLPSKSVSDDFEEIFSNFYLSGDTWLGRQVK